MEPEVENWLKANAIDFDLYDHPAVFTVEEAKMHCHHIPGVHCKNLFLKDSKSGIYYLITLPNDKTLRLNELRILASAKKLRMATPEELLLKLKLLPGSVSPLGLINNKEKDVIFIVDQSVWDAPLSCFHPNINTQSLTVKLKSFQKMVIAFKNDYRVIEIP